VTVNADLPGQLLRVLRMVTGRPALAYARAPEALSGGFWAELLAFSLTDPPEGWPRELVARVMPDPGLARKETIVQASVAAAGYPTPAVRAFGGPGCGLGRAFMVMDRAPGAPMLSGLSGAGAIAGALRVLGQLPEVLAFSMARLHALDPSCIRVQLGQAGDVPTTVAGVLGALRDTAAGYGRADLVEAARWLIGNPPPPAREVVCHGDLHPFNLLTDGEQVTVQAGGPGVVIGETVLGSLEACSLLAAGMSTNPAVAPAASELLQPYLEAARHERDSSLALRHMVDRSGTTHTFCFRRGRHLSFGIVFVAFGATFLAVAVADPSGRQAWGDVVLVAFGFALVWLGIRQLREGVQISGAKLTIRNDYRTRTVNASEIRAITLEPHTFGQVVYCWVPRVRLIDGRSIWIDNFDCGPAGKPPRPELAATVDEVRVLLGVRAEDVSTPDSRQPTDPASE
jgi:hypothetical protein